MLPSPGSRHRSVASIAVAVVVALLPCAVGAPSAGAAVAPTATAGLTTCLDQSPKVQVPALQVTRYRASVDTATAFDATGVRWYQVGSTPVVLSGTGGVCWSGGVIQGKYPSTTAWKTFSATGAFGVANPSATIDNLRVHGYGDGIRLQRGASDFLVRGAYASMMHDSCIANDKMNGGVVSQSRLDSCAIAFSAHRVAKDTTSDGSSSTMRISDSLVRLRSMPTVASGTAPGHGGFFDWDPNGHAPMLDLQGNVFRVDSKASWGSLGLPKGYDVTCSGNTIVWLGAGRFPGAPSWRAKCPDTVITRDSSAWTDAVARWNADLVGAARPTTTTTSTSTSTTTTSTSTTTTTAPPSTTTTTAPTTTTTTTPPSDPTPGSCTGPGAVVLAGPQSKRYKPTLTSPTAVDATTASWLQVDDWPVSVTGTAALCWHGGAITGTYPDTTSWSTFHSTGAFNVANPDSVVERLLVHNYGDGIRLRDGATHWTVRDVEESYLHDDCLENDRLYTGAITDSLLDGCYVAFSARPESSDTTSDGRTHTVTVDRSLVRLQPMPTVYKGPAPGTGGFFKWDDTGRSPRLSLHDSVFRADQLPNHGSLGLPDGYAVSCSGNVIVWLGAGPFPEAASWTAKCPDTVIVTDRAYWDAAVAGWRSRH